MAKKQIAGHGKKRPSINAKLASVSLDPENPRLPEAVQGGSEKTLIQHLYSEFDLDELARSMSDNGYFDEEPVVLVPKKMPAVFVNKTNDQLCNNQKYIDFIKSSTTQFVVVEGNRRVATAKILSDDGLIKELRIRHWPRLTKQSREDILEIPAIVYPTREEVLPYLGVRHISGIKKWEPYAKARYIASVIGKDTEKMKDVEDRVGGSSGDTRKIYVCYKLIEQVEREYSLDTKKAKDLFSYLVLAMGQNAIKEFIGVEKRSSIKSLARPVPKDKLENLKLLFIWLFGDGPKKQSIISDSRDITRKLSPVLRNPDSIRKLKEGADLDTAYEYSGGERDLLLKLLGRAQSSLQQALGMAFLHMDEQVVEQISTIEKIVMRLVTETEPSKKK